MAWGSTRCNCVWVTANVHSFISTRIKLSVLHQYCARIHNIHFILLHTPTLGLLCGLIQHSINHGKNLSHLVVSPTLMSFFYPYSTHSHLLFPSLSPPLFSHYKLQIPLIPQSLAVIFFRIAPLSSLIPSFSFPCS